MLRTQVEQQLTRLLSQLQDLEDNREDLEEEEYQETKSDTLSQIEDFQRTLKRMQEGNITLVDEFGRYQIAMQAIVSNAFRTPEIIKLFAKSQPALLRTKLEELQREHRLGNLPSAIYTQQKLEILSALQRLEEPLSEEETAFMDHNMTAEMKRFVNVAQEGAEAEGKKSNLLSKAGSDIKQAHSSKGEEEDEH